MQPGRRIAFDYGDVRIGVAITDTSGILATPLEFLTNSAEQLRTDLINVYENYLPIYTAVGYPLHTFGDDA